MVERTRSLWFPLFSRASQRDFNPWRLGSQFNCPSCRKSGHCTWCMDRRESERFSGHWSSLCPLLHRPCPLYFGLREKSLLPCSSRWKWSAHHRRPPQSLCESPGRWETGDVCCCQCLRNFNRTLWPLRCHGRLLPRTAVVVSCRWRPRCSSTRRAKE